MPGLDAVEKMISHYLAQSKQTIGAKLSVL